MNILVCFQHNFVMPCGVMLKSLVDNNNGVPIIVHAIVSQDVTDDDKNEIYKLLEDNKKNKVHFYLFRKDILDNYPGLKGTHFGESIYYRLFSGTLLPSSVDKIIYLDCDIIVNGNLNELWNIDLGDDALGAVVNPFNERKKLGNYEFEHYINSGVLLINLKYWREHDIEIKFIDCIQKNADILVYPDQDVLNAVLRDRTYILPIRFNVQYSFFAMDDYLRYYLGKQMKDLAESRLTPVIIHYTGPVKPWMKDCRHPLRMYFINYQRRTKWADIPLMVVKRKGKMKRWLKQILARVLDWAGVRNMNFVVYDEDLCRSIYQNSLKQINI